MEFYSYLSMALVVAANGLLIATPIFLIVGLLSKHGPHRTRRLKMALSNFVMFIATAIGVFWVMYLVLLPSIEGTSHEGFRLPYARLSDTMNFVSLILLIAAASFAVSMIFRTSVSRRGQLLRSLACLLLFSLVTGATYYLIYSIQMPAFARFIMIESRPYLTRVGELAPNAEFVMLDGTRVRLSELQGKTVLLNFFATWCGPCQNELPHLQQLWNEKQGDEGFTMLIVGREESQENVAAFKDAKEFTFPMAYDENREAYRLFAEEGIPRMYLIGKDGRILSQSIGFGEHEVYQNELKCLTELIETDLRSPR